eukprot:424672_1
MSACIHWFAVFISIMELSYSEYLVYYNAFERANESTTFTTTTNTDGVWVDGYKGHYGSLSTINSSTYCVCDGAYSCAIASSITADADCEGSLSCFQVSNLNGIYHDGSGVNSMHTHPFVQDLVTFTVEVNKVVLFLTSKNLLKFMLRVHTAC